MSVLELDILGQRISVSAPEWLHDHLEATLADLRATGPAELLTSLELVDGTDGGTLLDNGHVVRTGIAPGLEAATVVWWLNTIAGRSRHLVVHAGCVAGAGGVLLPAESGAGKSTLTASCVRHGLDYLSDEFAALDLHDGSLIPYPKPIGLDHDELVAASTLRPESVASACSPVAIVFPRFEAGASLSVAEVEPSWALVALASHTTNLASHGGAALPWLASIASACPAWQVTHGDAHEVAGLIEEAASVPVSVMSPAEVIGPITGDTTTVALGDNLAVFHEPTGRMHVLTQSAAFAWVAAAGTADAADRVDLALAKAPPGAIERQTMIATIDQLTELGLLDHTTRS